MWYLCTIAILRIAEMPNFERKDPHQTHHYIHLLCVRTTHFIMLMALCVVILCKNQQK